MTDFLNFLIEYKWGFLISAEVFFWVCAGAFFLARYWFEMSRLGNLFLGLIVAEEVLANLFILGLGALDYRQAGEITGYQIVAVAFILYALTLGRHDARRLDAYLKRKIAGYKGREIGEIPGAASATSTHSRLDKATRYRREWYEHLTLFAAGQIILFFFGASYPAALLGGGMPMDPSGLMTASQVWAVIFLVDTVWSLSYTVWPGDEAKGDSRR